MHSLRKLFKKSFENECKELNRNITNYKSAMFSENYSNAINVLFQRENFDLSVFKDNNGKLMLFKCYKKKNAKILYNHKANGKCSLHFPVELPNVSKIKN